MVALDPNSDCSAVITLLARLAFDCDASCAVAAWVNTPTSTRARSGCTETDAVPTAVIDAGADGLCAHAMAARTLPKMTVRMASPQIWTGPKSTVHQCERARPAQDYADCASASSAGSPANSVGSGCTLRTTDARAGQIRSISTSSAAANASRSIRYSATTPTSRPSSCNGTASAEVRLPCSG